MRAVDRQSAQKRGKFHSTRVFLTRVCMGSNATEPTGDSSTVIRFNMNVNKSLRFTQVSEAYTGSDLQYNLCFLNQDNIEVYVMLPWSHSKNLAGQRSQFMIEIAGGENEKL